MPVVRDISLVDECNQPMRDIGYVSKGENGIRGRRYFHILSLIVIEESDTDILLELLGVVKEVAAQITNEHGACRVLTNLGKYQDSKHLHWHVTFGEPLR